MKSKQVECSTLSNLCKLVIWGVSRIYSAGHHMGMISCIKQAQLQELWRLWYVWELEGDMI